MNNSGKFEVLSTRKGALRFVPSLCVAALAAVIALDASSAEAGYRRFIRTADGRIVVLGTSKSAFSTRFNKTALNPQPLPPKEMLSPITKIGLNPQPLPPKSHSLIRLPGFGR
jgi:hypothetical protein